MSQLFYRRHYDTIARVIGAGYFHCTSRAGEQMLDLVVKMCVRVFGQDNKLFDEVKFKRSIHLHSRDDDTTYPG